MFMEGLRFIQLKQISRKRNCLTDEVTKTLVTTLVLSNLNFCCSLYKGTSKNLFNRLENIQNYAARVITKSSKLSHITPILKQLKWLRVEQFIEFRYTMLIHKCLNNAAPSYLKKLKNLM